MTFARSARGRWALGLAVATWGLACGSNDPAAPGASPAAADGGGADGGHAGDAAPTGEGGSDRGDAGSQDASPSGPKAIVGPGRADFVFELQDLGIGVHTGKALDDEIATHGLGDVVARAPIKDALTGGAFPIDVDTEGLPVPTLGEWDYSLIHLRSGDVDGAGLARGRFPCFDQTQGCGAPAHAGQAYDRATAYFAARRDHEQRRYPTAKRFIAHTGHYFFAHYGAAFGAAMVVSEVGENISSIQAHLAFTRGAARQSSIPWGLDMSPWFSRGMLDYYQGADRVWCERDAAGNCSFYNSGSDHGHSLSLHARTWYAAYMGGASYVMQEGGSVVMFTSPRAPTALSPMGKLAQEFHAYVAAHPDRGTPYTPFAIVTDYYHGLGLGTWNKPAGQEVIWNHFPMDAAQRATLDLLDAFWPRSMRVSSASEAEYLVNAPVGDTVDVLTDTAPASVLGAYPVLFLTGQVHFTPSLKAAITTAIQRGAWVVLDKNPIHDAIYAELGSPALRAFVPGYTADQIGIADVSGHVLRVASSTTYPALIREIAPYFLPFAVSGGLGFALGRTGAKSWIVTLTNNDGVNKQPLTPTVVSGGPATATLTAPAGAAFKKVAALRSAHAPAFDARAVRVAVDAGEVAILAVELE